MKRLSLLLSSAVVLVCSANAADPAVEQIFQALDTDKSGQLSKQEFESRPEVYKGTEFEHYGCFEIADVNNDKLLSLEEMEAYNEPIPCE